MRLTIYSHFEGKTWTGDAAIRDHENEYRVLERIFAAFNRVDDDDVVRLERIGYRLPSLSVGDRVTFVSGSRRDGRTYVVENVGFSEIVESESKS